MKKIVSLLLAVCMCLSVGVMLASCGGEEHTHTYKTEWSKDATHHWHACEGEDCTDVADKAEHTWNNGEVTTPATTEADGVKTFTCTACGQTKTEAIEYVPDHTVTQEEWRSALTKENFYNVTLIYNNYQHNEENESAELEYTTRYEYDGALMRNDGSKVVENSGDMDTEEVFSVVGRALEHYADTEYDEEAQHYFLMLYDDYYEMMFGLIYQFTDGKLTHFELHFLSNGTADEMYRSRWMEWKFSDYGTTVVEIPAVNTTVTEEEWEAVFVFDVDVFQVIEEYSDSYGELYAYYDTTKVVANDGTDRFAVVYLKEADDGYVQYYTEVSSLWDVDTADNFTKTSVTENTFISYFKMTLSQFIEHYDKFEYDEEQRCYVASAVNDDVLSATVYFVDGKIIKVQYTDSYNYITEYEIRYDDVVLTLPAVK